MTGPFDIIVADPPWKFSSNSKAKPGRNAMRHYDCMTDAEIKNLPVADWAAPNCLLFMWVTAPMLRRAIEIPESWGFRYVSEMMWAKERIGTGFWVRNRHEPILIYKRGKFPCPKPAPFPDSIISGQQREHSRKPDRLQEEIDRIWPNACKLEMFARQERAGWHAFGNQTDKFGAVA